VLYWLAVSCNKNKQRKNLFRSSKQLPEEGGILKKNAIISGYQETKRPSLQ
jgi:hypothetical protein